jgi:hypothetical protein
MVELVLIVGISIILSFGLGFQIGRKTQIDKISKKLRDKILDKIIE